MGGDLTTDVLIIGSGPVGATFARLLAGSGRYVTMIDTGPQLSVPAGSHQANAFIYQQQPNLFLDIIGAQLEVFSIPPSTRTTLPPPGYNPTLGRLNFENPNQQPDLNMPYAAASYAVGGMGTHWTCCTPDPAPMERTPLIPDGDWEQMLPIVRTLLNVHTDAFCPSFGNDVLKTTLRRAGYPVDNLPLAAEKRNATSKRAYLVNWTGTDTVLGPLLDPLTDAGRHFTLLPQHRADQLILAGNGVAGAVVRDLDRMETKNIFAGTVVVAGGPFLTPRLLWQSGIQPYALGRYLNANNTASATVVLNDSVIDALRQIPDNPARNEVIPIAWNDPPVMLGFAPTVDRPWHAQIQRYGQYISYDFGMDQPFTDARIVVDLLWYGTIEPNPDNRIVFDPILKDRFDQPQITIEYRLSDTDVANGKLVLADMTAAAQSIGVFVPGSGQPIMETPGSTLHYQSTCRMGDDNGRESVVDPYGKVWGFDNLYLGSVGVIPNSMASNPTPTACAIAVRSAAQICGVSLTEMARALA